MEIMSLKEIRSELSEHRLLRVADQCDLSYPTIRKLAMGSADNYSLDTIIKVSNYLRENKQDV